MINHYLLIVRNCGNDEKFVFYCLTFAKLKKLYKSRRESNAINLLFVWLASLVVYFFKSKCLGMK